MKSSDEIYAVRPFGPREGRGYGSEAKNSCGCRPDAASGVLGMINLRGEHVRPQMGSIRPISPAQLAGDLVRCQHYQTHGFFH
jgi:hypothetical protein